MGKVLNLHHVFAEAQTRLLGKSVILLEKPAQISETIDKLLNNRELLQEIKENGKKRMGKPGAAKRIAQSILQMIND